MTLTQFFFCNKHNYIAIKTTDYLQFPNSVAPSVLSSCSIILSLHGILFCSLQNRGKSLLPFKLLMSLTFADDLLDLCNLISGWPCFVKKYEAAFYRAGTRSCGSVLQTTQTEGVCGEKRRRSSEGHFNSNKNTVSGD